VELLVAAVLLEGGFVPLSPSVITFYYFAALAAGAMLAWRFQSSQILSALLVISLSHRAIEFFSGGHAIVPGPGRIAFDAIAFLLPLNLLIVTLRRETSIQLSALAPYLGFLFLQSVFVAIICSPGSTKAPLVFRMDLLNPKWSHWTSIPQISLFLSCTCIAFIAGWLLRYSKPVDAGLLWALIAILIAFQRGGVGKVSSAYWGTAALILGSSIIETTYAIAYYDELTLLPGRRAFNQAVAQLERPYAIAAVDIDHFKSVNDTYGHDTGDQVLRMVAARLAKVTGGGTAYRVGGEEFNIIFPGRTAKEVLPNLEQLRVAVENSVFRLRLVEDRRGAARGPDRRAKARKKKSAPTRDVYCDGLAVTISIGAAESGTGLHPIAFETVLEAADKALYRAKRAGRNRIEVSSGIRTRARKSIA
jgi:diguanylate cyclase (GGDEF)-like protein